MRLILLALSPLALVAAPLAAANLIVNGGFEASTGTTTTPTGWTNVGHSDGVINYSIGPVPAYEGSYFYDLGGYGNASGPVGDGIMQTVSTVAGQKYKLVFGLSSEDVAGITRLDVSVGSLLTSFTQGSGGTYFRKGFTTQTIDYTATGASTTVKFIEGLNTSGGNNDPLLDGVMFLGAAGVPEPATWGMMLVGFGALGGVMRAGRKSAVVAA